MFHAEKGGLRFIQNLLSEPAVVLIISDKWEFIVINSESVYIIASKNWWKTE